MPEFTMLQFVVLFFVSAIAAPCFAAMAFLLIFEEVKRAAKNLD